MELKKDEIIEHRVDAHSSIKFGLSIKCAPNNRNYIFIPTDTEAIDLTVISKVKNENLNFLSKFVSISFLNVMNIL